MVSAEVLDFTLQCGIILSLQGPIHQVGELCPLSQQELVFRGDGSVVLSDGMGVKGARVDGTTASISGKELGEGCMEVVGDEGGNDVLIAIRNNEEVTRTNGVEVVLPARTRKHTWLGTCGTRGMFLCVSVHRFGFQRFDFDLLV